MISGFTERLRGKINIDGALAQNGIRSNDGVLFARRILHAANSQITSACFGGARAARARHWPGRCKFLRTQPAL